MRLIPDNHPAAAIVGETETTKKPQAFPHPELKHVVIWDMPGSGTASHPIDTYFKDKCLIGFDALIVNCTYGMFTRPPFFSANPICISCSLTLRGVVTEGELYIAKEADRAGIPVIIVRNKANNDLESRRRRCPVCQCANVFTNYLLIFVFVEPQEKTKETHKAELIAEFRSNIKKDLATKTLSHLPIFVVNAWSFLDPESPSFEEKEFMEMLHKIASKRN